jgi:hypothetical protein
MLSLDIYYSCSRCLAQPVQATQKIFSIPSFLVYASLQLFHFANNLVKLFRGLLSLWLSPALQKKVHGVFRDKRAAFSIIGFISPAYLVKLEIYLSLFESQKNTPVLQDQTTPYEVIRRAIF